MKQKMPCHFSDGPLDPEQVFHVEPPDEDEAHDAERQRRLDQGLCVFCGERQIRPDERMCGACRADYNELSENR